ncbi:unnamed protein product [Paramecium pentaurelia]|uniref:Uncharacterized protein n=1 Tax=Paramecium pentaurelia TaxID=43138 RepID=A0A8S1XL03_9CILI|nr:unnamed protein product [Paramecium pentaurelia]
MVTKNLQYCLNHFQKKYKRPTLQMKINYFGTPYFSTKTKQITYENYFFITIWNKKNSSKINPQLQNILWQYPLYLLLLLKELKYIPKLDQLYFLPKEVSQWNHTSF